jgi:molybdopterin-guanine dinucleotide biosynthesis protein A
MTGRSEMTGRTGQTIAAIVLAGGRSSRFGRDKLAEPVHGQPLIGHAIGAVRHVTAEVLVVVAPGADPGFTEGVRIVHDERAFEGPLAGVAAGLVATDAEIVLVVAGDMPTVVPGVLRRLVTCLTTTAADAAVLEVGEDRPPIPMAVRRSAASAAAGALLASGERRLRALPEALHAAGVPERAWREDDPEGASLLDIDTAADLA